MKETIVININEKASVHLTDYGKHVLDVHRMELEESAGIDLKEILHYDENDVFSSELWEIMSIFGRFMYNGAKQAFHDNAITIGSITIPSIAIIPKELFKK